MSELYYAEMEAARNTTVEAYFLARPQADSLANRTIFKAGFERAFAMLWKEPPRPPRLHIPESTQCWSCHKEYSFTLPKCPHCGKTNANVDAEAVQNEQRAARKTGTEHE
jgi:hypothetical protein